MIEALENILAGIDRVAVAVSGGVDSTTLAAVAHRRLGNGAEAWHAISPAVPPEATARVRALAARLGWVLHTVDAGEFTDEAYLANPVDRCFYCKTNLYGTIAGHTDRTIVSGANLDDLGDYRPGMNAAAEHGVRHPYVEAGIDKAGVRAIATALGLGDLASLPASPCLSSRIETGLRVDAGDLDLVHGVETLVSGWLAGQNLIPGAVRCRIRHDGIAVELDPAGLTAVSASASVRAEVIDLVGEHGHGAAVRFEPYRQGSAFLRNEPT
jgi:pyridinium-3,5-biscarboxylic acid mononucleotide sulfurtransferase